MSPGLVKVAERAKREPEARFHSLAHLIDEVALRRAYDRIREDTRLESRAGDVGARLGAFILAGGDPLRHERRFTALASEEQREVLRWLEGLGDDLRYSGLCFIRDYLGNFEASLRRAQDGLATRIIT
jgi:hypothetical protein